jgi:hypothetical protein
VAGEPGGLLLSGGHPAGEDDLEGALAEVDGRGLDGGAGSVAQRQLVVAQAVKAVAAPVEFFLQRDHR